MILFLKKIKRFVLRIISYFVARNTELKKISRWDYDRYQRHMGYLHSQNIGFIKAELLMRTHGLEKGMTMPSFRLGFGTEKISVLDGYLNSYLMCGGKQGDYEYRSALSAMAEYDAIHRAAGTCLPERTHNTLRKHLNTYADTMSHQPTMTREAFYEHNEGNLPEFMASRHSVRHFSGPAPLNALEAAISMARFAPSACNRQYVHAHLLLNKEVVQQVLQLQGGNNGFGHLAEQVILITVNLNAVIWLGERHDLWFNAGLFSMALYNALHYHKVGYCPLLWHDLPEKDTALRKLVHFPENELPVSLIVCGEVPEQFTVALSSRKPVESYMSVHR